jgi:hypothetical protein
VPVTSKPLIPSKYAANAETTEYTAPAGVRVIVDKLSGYNGSGGSVSVTVKLVPSGGSAGASNIIESRSIAAGDTWGFPHIVGHSLEPGGFVSIIASAASAVVVRASGREVN